MSLDPLILAELQRGGPPLWVSGRTYPKGWEVRSPANLQRYVRKVAGAGAADPSADSGNWEPWSKTVDATLASLGTSVANVKAVADALATTLTSVKSTVDALSAKPIIKSVQRGVFEIGATAGTVNIAVSAVVVSKSMLNVIPPGNINLMSSGAPTIQLTSSTTITVSNLQTDNISKKFSWELIEFN